MKIAKLRLDKHFTIAPVDRRLFGVFIEPIRTIVYGSIYNPVHPNADEHGFRKDVIALMRELGPSAIRYPGGNYISNYHWQDGIGPKENRPTRYDKAWYAVDNNHMGIDEYTDWIQKIGAEPMLTVNLGTGTPEEAAQEIEYTNMKGGTYFSDLRRKYGHEKPHRIRLWYLGNEMDGPWQMGEKTADEYGRVAYETAKQMRAVDPDIELVACGSCLNYDLLPTYPDWDRIVLEHCYEKVDYLSIHRYYHYDKERVRDSAFPMQFNPEDIPYIPCDLDNFIDTICAAADFVKARKYSNKTVNISLDEWGVISSSAIKIEGLNWNERVSVPKDKPRSAMNVIDAVLFGSILITLINRCDRVKIACQSIAIGSLIGVDAKGGSWRQTTFYPFQHAAAYANGVTLRPALESPLKQTESYGERPAIQAAAVYNEEEGMVTIFVVNLDLRETIAFEPDFAFEEARLTTHIQLHESQPLAGNTLEDPNRVIPRNLEVDARVTQIEMPPLSWNVLRFAV
jgi:alpha-N-arabinofuranosidase